MQGVEGREYEQFETWICAFIFWTKLLGHLETTSFWAYKLSTSWCTYIWMLLLFMSIGPLSLVSFLESSLKLLLCSSQDKGGCVTFRLHSEWHNFFSKIGGIAASSFYNSPLSIALQSWLWEICPSAIFTGFIICMTSFCSCCAHDASCNLALRNFYYTISLKWIFCHEQLVDGLLWTGGDIYFALSLNSNRNAALYTENCT